MTGNVVRLEGERRPGLPWMNRLHADRGAIAIDDLPELLGDVFAWNKLFRRDFWDSAGLAWPERIRYEDQPCTTDAYLRAGRIGVTPEVVYHWRMRDDGTSITQQRATVADLADRWTTKRMALDLRRGVRRRGGHRGLPRPGAAGRHVAVLRATSPTAPTSGGTCW